MVLLQAVGGRGLSLPSLKELIIIGRRMGVLIWMREGRTRSPRLPPSLFTYLVTLVVLFTRGLQDFKKAIEGVQLTERGHCRVERDRGCFQMFILAGTDVTQMLRRLSLWNSFCCYAPRLEHYIRAGYYTTGAGWRLAKH